MSGSTRGLWAGLTFLVGFGAALWLTGAAAGGLRGPRAALMRELNVLRAEARLPALRSDRHLGQVAQQHAQSLARGSSVAAALAAPELERTARSRGWRGAGPVSELRLRAADLGAALRAAVTPECELGSTATRAGVGLAPAPDGSVVAVVLLAR